MNCDAWCLEREERGSTNKVLSKAKLYFPGFISDTTITAGLQLK